MKKFNLMAIIAVIALASGIFFNIKKNSTIDPADKQRFQDISVISWVLAALFGGIAIGARKGSIANLPTVSIAG